MSTRPPSRRGHAGFTLLELLVVVLLLSIMIGGAVLALGDGGRQDRLHQEARRLHQLLTLAGEEAVLQSREIGLVLQQQDYHFMQYDGAAWQPLPDELLRPRTLPDDMMFELYLDGLLVVLPLLASSTGSEGAPQPQLVLFSSGERSPFELVVAYRHPPELAYRLHGELLGPLRLEREAQPW